jgi:hypothetical protein
MDSLSTDLLISVLSGNTNCLADSCGKSVWICNGGCFAGLFLA